MLKFMSLRKLGLSIAVVMVATLFMPLISYAAQTIWFTYNPTTGKLSGQVYIHDPNKVSIQVTNPQGVTNVTYLTYGTVVGTTYDDNNVLLKAVKYDLNLDPNQAPSQITMNVCNQTSTLSKSVWTDSTVSYYSSDSFSSGAYRSPGHQYFSEIAAGSYMPSGAKLVSFTPQLDGRNSVELYLPYNNSDQNHIIATQIDPTKFTVSDLALVDTTTNQSVSIDSLKYVGNFYFYFNTTSTLIKNHNYELSLSNTSGGNEFLHPAASGSYQAKVYLETHPYSDSNIVTFYPINLGNATPGGTPNYQGNGSPYGTMDNCSDSITPPTNGGADPDPGNGNGDGDGGNSGGHDTSPITPAPDTGITDGANGIKLGKGASTVTKDTNSEGKQVTKVVLDADKLGKALGLLKDKDKGSQTVSIEINGSDPISQVQLPVGALADSPKDSSAVISIKNESASYDLPIQLLDLTLLSSQLGASLKDITLTIQIEKITGTKAEQIDNKAKSMNVELLTDPVDFSITAEANGKKQEINNFGNRYVTRTLTVPQALHANLASAVTFDEKTGKLMFVPAIFTTINGTTEVTIKRNSNSIYTVVQGQQTFNDLSGHWAKEDVELLATKHLVEGTAAHTFSPEQVISRAEFATLLSRALGLTEDKSSMTFKDVDSSSWYQGSVGAAVKAGLIEGYENGTFRPNAKITREQMAVMIAKALRFTGKSVDAANESQLASFEDKDAISSWARNSTVQVTNAGILTGLTKSAFAPQSEATRAQAVVMLKRLLQVIEFIN